MTDIDPDDVRAMRSENGGKDFRLFMRQQIRDGNARRGQPPSAPAPPPPPGYRPGAWPAGTGPAPVTSEWTPEWTQALEEYRVWLATTNHPELDHPTTARQVCGCPACTPRSDS